MFTYIFSFKCHGGFKSIFLYGKQLEKYFVLDLISVEKGHPGRQMKEFAHAASKKLLVSLPFFALICNYALCSNYALSMLMTTSIYHRILQSLHTSYIGSFCFRIFVFLSSNM